MSEISAGVNGIPANDVVIFDPAMALRATGDDRQILGEIIGVYLESLPSLMDRVSGALEAGDARSVELHAHSLKGASSNVGGQRVRAVALSMEKAGKAGDMEAARSLLPALTQEVASFAAHLRGLDPAAL